MSRIVWIELPIASQKGSINVGIVRRFVASSLASVGTTCHHSRGYDRAPDFCSGPVRGPPAQGAKQKTRSMASSQRRGRFAASFAIHASRCDADHRHDGPQQTIRVHLSGGIRAIATPKQERVSGLAAPGSSGERGAIGIPRYGANEHGGNHQAQTQLGRVSRSRWRLCIHQ